MSVPVWEGLRRWMHSEDCAETRWEGERKTKRRPRKVEVVGASGCA